MSASPKREHKLVVTGATGLIGNALMERFPNAVGLTRGTPTSFRYRQWNPDQNNQVVDLDGFDAVVHLAGEPVAGGRWTESRRKKIRDSRVEGTKKTGRKTRPIENETEGIDNRVGNRNLRRERFRNP